MANRNAERKKGDYLVTLKNGCVKFDGFAIDGRKKWFIYNSDFVLAWCKLSDIEPYKECNYGITRNF